MTLQASLDVAKHFNPPRGTGKPQPPAAQKLPLYNNGVVEQQESVESPAQDEATRLAYATGIKELEPIVRRLLEVERQVNELKKAQTFPHLTGLEKRTA